MRSVGEVLISLSYAVSPLMDTPLTSVMHGPCDARPTVTFPVAQDHRLLTVSKLYCLARACEGLARQR